MIMRCLFLSIAIALSVPAAHAAAPATNAAAPATNAAAPATNAAADRKSVV